MTALRRYRDWALIIAAGTAVLAGLIWLGLELFPLMSWDVYETGRLFIVAFLAAVLATVFGNARAYVKGKADGYQHGHDVGYQAGWEASIDEDDADDSTDIWDDGRPFGFLHSGDYHVSTEPGTTNLMTGSRFPDSHIYTTE